MMVMSSMVVTAEAWDRNPKRMTMPRIADKDAIDTPLIIDQPRPSN